MPLTPDQEKIATILYEYEETNKRLAFKEAEASRIGSLFNTMATALLQSPACIIFERESVPIQFGDRGRLFKVEDFNVERIKALAGEIRALEMRLSKLTQERQQLGFPVG